MLEANGFVDLKRLSMELVHEANERFKSVVDVLDDLIWPEVVWEFSQRLGGVDKKCVDVFILFDVVWILESPGREVYSMLCLRFWSELS